MIGCRFAIYPMTDDFVDVILGAIRTVDTSGMAVTTDSLGTLFIGEEEKVLCAVQATFEAASRHAGHVVMTLHLSRGCPGEPEDYCDPTGRPMD